MVKAKGTLKQAQTQLEQCKATIENTEYTKDAYGAALRKQHGVALNRAFMVYNTILIEIQQEIDIAS